MEEWQWIALFPVAVVIGWGALIAGARPILLALLAGLLLYGVLLAVSIRQPLVFVTVFLVVLMILPPFYVSWLGAMPIYVSTLLVPIALAILLLRLPERRFRLDPIATGLVLFLIGTGLSLPFAFLLSGNAIGTQSLFRWLLLAQTALIYAIIRTSGVGDSARRVIPWLLILAVVSAGYGIIDFFSPVPLPHPAADQFIWLESEVMRRAQGVFYESCYFANFCGFFLVVASAALLAMQERVVRIGRFWLLAFIIILALADVFAFSRSAWTSVLLSLLVFSAISKQVKIEREVVFLLVLGTALTVVCLYVPEIWNYVVAVRLGDLTQIFTHPNLATSGRFDTWARVVSILQNHPQYLLFGIGYKTLPFTRLFHGEIITDNGYLSLTLETGALGLGGFVIFCGSVFKTFFGLARRRGGVVAFWSAVLFSFWCGECLQMLAADAHTYWRNMIVFTALMAFTLNWAEKEPISQPSAATVQWEPAI